MKKILCIVTLLIAVITTHAQGMFDQLEDLNDVSTVVITKDAFELLRKFPNTNSQDMKVFNTARGLEELKVFSTENMQVATKMEQLVNSAIKSGNMTQLMRVKDNTSRVKIYIKSTKNKDMVREVLMFVNDLDADNKPSSVIISLIGQINMNELAKIANDYEKKQ